MDDQPHHRGEYAAFLYCSRTFSNGLDDTQRFTSEEAALKWARTVVKSSRAAGAHAIVGDKTISKTRTGRLQVRPSAKAWR
jgi:peptide subunit release factor RF-3